jgi:hypothetical protein
MNSKQWFKSYLHNRKQQAEINTPDSNNGIYTDWGGLPRGSILGPLLFLICINDLPKTSTLLVADDTNTVSHPKITAFRIP